jgi:hypothetical protein
MTELGRISKTDLDRLPSMDPVEAALVLRAVLTPPRAPASCTRCNLRKLVVPRCNTTYAGMCECGGALELVDYS